MPRLPLCAFVFGLCLVGCPGRQDAVDGGSDAGTLPLSVTSVAPDRGPVGGGTVVTVNGTGFVDGASVVFAATASPSVTFESSRRLLAVAPAVPQGRVSVTVVNPDGRQATLPAAFLFEGTTTGTIVDGVALNPSNSTDTSGANPLRIAVKGQVKVPGRTDTEGAPMGVTAQVAFAPEGSTSFAWVDAPWLEDADLYDTFQGLVTLPAPMGLSVATYVLGVRFSVTGGASWVEADRDGTMNGVQEAQRPRITVSRPVVGWCKLGGEQTDPPPQLEVRIGQAGPLIYGQVYAMGVTNMFGVGPGVQGQLGVGDAGTPVETWAWFPATFNRDTGTAANDELMAAMPTLPELAGDKRFAFRFGLNGGPWRYCDADGLSVGGFTEDQTGRVRIASAAIDSCRLQFPLSLMSRQGMVAGTVYGRVLSSGVTEAAGAGVGIEAQLGVGPTASLPSDTWSWVPATYNVEVGGGEEEWQADLVGPAPGSYAYAYRFRYQGGPWAYCDSDPADMMIQTSQLGALTAQSSTFKAIASCKLQFVDRSSVPSGDAVVAYGRVSVPGFSEGAGVTAGLRGEVGVGPQGTNASNDPSWGWKPATFNVDIADAGEDELMASFSPAYTGARAVAFRFAVDDGGWSYCDLNGSNVGGFETGQQFALTVERTSVPYCVLQFPASADAGTAIYGQVYVPGVTRDAGAPIVGELGVGPEREDPGVAPSWTWAPATYNESCQGCGDNNEYQATLPARDGGAYAYRFRYGASTCYADLDGAGSILPMNVGGFTSSGGANLGQIR